MLLYLSLAFDTVDHDILLQVLDKKFGVKGNVLQWFDRYLRPRWFTVCINGIYSSKMEILFSIPQGLINGPVLFSSYSSTIWSVIDKSIKTNAFPDNHSLQKDFGPIPTEEIAVGSQLENNLGQRNSWMNENCLKLNPGKTEFILFGSNLQHGKCITTSLNACGTRVLKSDVVRYLRTWFDKMLNFNHHVQQKCKWAMWNLKRIWSIRNALERESYMTLICSLVLSHLDYGSCCFFDISEYLITKMKQIQNYAAWVVLMKNKTSNSNVALHNLHWLPIKTQIECRILCIVHKCIYDSISSTYLKKSLSAYKMWRN